MKNDSMKKPTSTELMSIANVESINTRKKDIELLASATKIVIIDQTSCVLAKNTYEEIKTRRKDEERRLNIICNGFHKAWKSATEKRTEILEPYEQAEKSLEQCIIVYEDLAEIERKRLELELEKSAELEARAAREAEIKALMVTGRKKEAAILKREQIVVTSIVLPKDDTAIVGQSAQTYWEFDVIDKTLIPRGFLMLDLPKIGKEVRSMKELTNIPGIKPRPRKGLVSHE